MTQTKTQPQLAALSPADPLGARFCQYFNNPWKHIYKPLAAVGEKTQWKTANYFLNPRTLWERYLDPDTVIGLRFGSSTRYCLLDVDRGSCYHPASNYAAFKSVLAALEEIGLCRKRILLSSDSGGLHIYFFFDEPLPTFGLACALWFALDDAGLRVRNGQLETFPNMKAYGSLYNGCRLPLQAGSYLVNDELEILTNDLNQFLDAADTDAAHQDLSKLKEAIAAASIRRKRKQTNKLSEDDEVWKANWEQIIAQGWTGAGQTNELLKIMVAYGTVFQGLKGKELVDYVEAIAIVAPGYLTYCSHQHEIRQRATHWVSSTEHNEFYSEYCSYPNRRGTYKQTFGAESANNVIRFKSNLNEQRSNEAYYRVRQAVAHLKELCKLPKAIGARAKAIIDTAKNLFGKGVSMLTLRKSSYLSLWHPRFDQASTAAELNSDSTCLDGGDVELFSNALSIKCLQQPSIQTPNRLISSGESLATPSSSDQVDSNTNLKQPLIHDEIPSSIAASNCSTETESVVREVLPKPLPDVEPPTQITPPLVVHENQEQQESLEAAQLLDSSSLDHTPPLMKVCGQDEGQPSPPQGEGAQPLIQPLELSGGEREGGYLPTSAPAAPATPATPATPDAPMAVPAAPKVPQPTGPSPRETWRLMGIRLEAAKKAKTAVRLQALAERCLLDPDERQRRETVVTMQFLWDSGDPVWRQEVKLWLAADPSRRLNLESP